MSERIEAIKQKLTSARDYLEGILDQVGDRWDTQVYSEGAAWTVGQLAIHLSVTDKGHNNTIIGIAKGEETIPADFDLERFNRRSVEKRAEMTPAQVREALIAAENERNAWLDSIDDATLDKTGRHGSMRILSIAEILGVIADHDRNHADDIARVLGIGG